MKLIYRNKIRVIATVLAVGTALGGADLNAQKKTEDAAAILSKASKTLANLKSLTFTYSAKPVPSGLSLAAVSNGSGQAASADRMVFQGTIQHSPAIAMPFVLATCGKDPYIDMGDGVFTPMPGAPNIGSLLFSSDTSFLAGTLTQLTELSKPESKTVDKVDAWYLKGKAPATLLAKLPGRKAGTPSSPDIELWIGKKDYNVLKVSINGQLFNGDDSKAQRILTFSQFNEKIALTVPRGELPCKEESR